IGAGRVALGRLHELRARPMEVGTQASLSPAWPEPLGDGWGAARRHLLSRCPGRLIPRSRRLGGCPARLAEAPHAPDPIPPPPPPPPPPPAPPRQHPAQFAHTRRNRAALA